MNQNNSVTNPLSIDELLILILSFNLNTQHVKRIAGTDESLNFRPESSYRDYKNHRSVNKQFKRVVNEILKLDINSLGLNHLREAIQAIKKLGVTGQLTTEEFKGIKQASEALVKEFAPAESHYIGIGNSPTPITAYLQMTVPQSHITNIPIGDIGGSKNRFFAGRLDTEEEWDKHKAVFKKYFDKFLTTAVEDFQEGKNIVVIDYISYGVSLRLARDLITNYIANKSYEHKLKDFLEQFPEIREPSETFDARFKGYLKNIDSIPLITNNLSDIEFSSSGQFITQANIEHHVGKVEDFESVTDFHRALVNFLSQFPEINESDYNTVDSVGFLLNEQGQWENDFNILQNLNNISISQGAKLTRVDIDTYVGKVDEIKKDAAERVKVFGMFHGNSTSALNRSQSVNQAFIAEKRGLVDLPTHTIHQLNPALGESLHAKTIKGKNLTLFKSKPYDDLTKGDTKVVPTLAQHLRLNIDLNNKIETEEKLPSTPSFRK